MNLSGVFSRRIRGFRVVDLAALALVLTLAFTVYGFKTLAGGQGANIADVESQIHNESRRVRLLQAEIAHLESPDRLERLASQYRHFAPIEAKQEVTPEALSEVAARAPARPEPQPVSQPVPAVKP